VVVLLLKFLCSHFKGYEPNWQLEQLFSAANFWVLGWSQKRLQALLLLIR
jgi:hypothetical protein